MTKALVLGLGKSGIAAFKLLVKKGYEVVGFDDDPKTAEKASHLGITLITDSAHINWQSIACLVVSPGIASTHSLYRGALEQQIKVLSEVQLALSFLQLAQKKIAVTGTNGKTTVTLMLEHILQTAGIKAKALGNVGFALSTYALNPDLQDVLVIELSSFQLERPDLLHTLDAACILNVTPDHLDRYPDMHTYAHAKCNVQKYLKERGFLCVGEQVAREYGDLLCHPYRILEHSDIHLDDYLAPHDKENIRAAWNLSQPFGISRQTFDAAVQTFKKPSHRIEFVREINGVCYYDDSKGTNVDAVVQAVHAMNCPVILIAGGVDKGASYMPWVSCFAGKVKCILVFGQAALKIKNALQNFFTVEHVGSLSDAVAYAHKLAVCGDVVLLSPGCASYDMFVDYAHRGEEFQRYVYSLD